MYSVFRLLPLAVLIACAEPEGEATIAAEPAAEEAAAPLAEDPAAVRSALEAINAQHVDAFNQGDVATFAQVYTEDARILPPGMAPIEGRAQIQEFWTGGAQQMGMRDLELTTDEVQVAGDHAFEQGRFQFMTNGGPAQGKYLVVWQKQPDGSWKWHRDIWNESPAAE
jgi:uncharacterized protein (TIGR02246 family)